MAERPVFISTPNQDCLVQTRPVPLTWFPGFSVAQKQRSIASLHESISQLFGQIETLEISSKSMQPLGVQLSAFNLTIRTVRYRREFSVESAFQSSKVFECGGPYQDLLDKTAREAKRDERLRQSGRLTKFVFFGIEWALEPKTAFYDWLYINALRKHEELASAVLQYCAFTDIEFNPEKQINCQARSAALFVSLQARNLVGEAISSREAFINVVGSISSSHVQQNLLEGSQPGSCL